MSKKNEEISAVDLAYKILNDAGKENPLNYKDLILDILSRQNKSVQNEAAAISEIYTLINMDSRFQHLGNGMWGLTEWNPPEVKRTRSTARTATAKTTSRRTSALLEEVQE